MGRLAFALRWRFCCRVCRRTVADNQRALGADAVGHAVEFRFERQPRTSGAVERAAAKYGVAMLDERVGVVAVESGVGTAERPSAQCCCWSHRLSSHFLSLRRSSSHNQNFSTTRHEHVAQRPSRRAQRRVFQPLAPRYNKPSCRTDHIHPAFPPYYESGLQLR